MKTVIVTIVCSVLIAGCASVGRDPGMAYSPTTAKESFSIGAFKPSATEYNFKHYDQGMAVAFLASVNDRFSNGDIVALDGLKWQKDKGEWYAIPNPPIPVLKPGDDLGDYTRAYAEWVNNHPHFGYPPIPMDNKQ